MRLLVSTYLRTVEHDWRGDHGGAGIYPRHTWGMPCMAISAFSRPGRTADPNDRISKEPSCHLHIKQNAGDPVMPMSERVVPSDMPKVGRVPDRMVITVCACLPVIVAINIMAAEISLSMAWGLRPDTLDPASFWVDRYGSTFPG